MDTENFDIAIIGMSGQFPQAENITAFWENLIAGKECLQRLTPDELARAGVTEAECQSPHYVKAAGMLKDVDQFAAEFFGYTPREASLIDPQQRKMLEHTWHAFEDASINPTNYPGSIGVYVGSSLNTYLLNNLLSHPTLKNADDLQQILFGNGCDYLATRIAYLFNLKGPALNIQTACSTSLVAVSEACQHLLSYQVDVAIAGAVSIASPQGKGYLYSVDGMLSPDGHCRPFSEKAEGTVFSSGVGVIVLKRLCDALADDDAIYAVIKGSAVNNDGQQKVGYTAPSVEGQAEVITLAQGLANITPEQISYIEAHGTATALGDLIEVKALERVFLKNKQKKQFCALGSVKSNIGHLDVAAGIAGLIKMVLSLKHQKIPATLHSKELNQKIAWQDSPFYVNDTLCDWQTGQDELRIGAVSSFGIGGTNAHIILSEAPPAMESQIKKEFALFIFSAKTPGELNQIIETYCIYIQDRPKLSIHSVARTLQEGRVSWNYRLAWIVHSLEDAISQMRDGAYAIVNCEQQLSHLLPKPIDACTFDDLQLLKQQWLQGYDIEWQAHYATTKPPKLHLPVYPFSKSRYFVDHYQAEETTTNKKKCIDEWFYLPSWRESIPVNNDNTLKESIRLLVLCDETIFKKTYLNYLKVNELIYVGLGKKFQQLTENEFNINIENPSDYVFLLQHLKNENKLPTHFLHASSLTHSFKASSHAVFLAEQTPGLLSILYFMQAFEQVAQDHSLKITILTNRLNEITHTGEVEPHKAPIIAAVKVIPKEYVKIATQLIDIDAISHPLFLDYQLTSLNEDIHQKNYDQEEIVYRGRKRYIRDYVATSIKSKPIQLSQNKLSKTILITGGLGQLGLDVADYFATFKPYHIALLARTVIPHETDWQDIISQYDKDHPLALMLQRIIHMRSMGAKVNVFSADVSDKDSLQTAIQQIENEMGEIVGIIHAAGETINGIISMKQLSSLDESYQAKVVGTYHLHELFANKLLDFFILCSSMNAIIGGLGQLDNTAANAFIDYMADYMAAKSGQNIFAINWGAININRPMKVNVLEQFTDLSHEHKKNYMTDDEVNEVYHRLLSARLGSRIVISTIDMNVILRNWNRVASIIELAKDRSIHRVDHFSSNKKTIVPSSDIKIWLCHHWQQLLGVAAVAPEDNFFTLGGHSLAAVQLMTKIRETFHLKIHVMTLYELPTLKQFSEYVDKQLKIKVRTLVDVKGA